MGFGGINLKEKLNSNVTESLQEFVSKFARTTKSLRAPDSHILPEAKNVLAGILRHYSDHSEALIGVDIIPGHIRICQMEESNDTWKLTHLASDHIEGEFSTKDMREHVDTYIEKLRVLIKENNISAKNAAVAIPVSESIIKTMTIPNMTDVEIEQAIEMGSFWQNLIQLPGNLEDYSIFYEVVKRNSDDNTMDLLFVGSHTEDISLYSEIINGAGLNPSIIDVRCFALNNIYHANSSEDAQKEPVVFLKFGLDENYIHIIDRGESYIYDIYISDEERSTIMDHFNDVEILQRYATQAKQIISSHENSHASEKIKDILVVSLLPAIGPFVKKLSAIVKEYNISECNFFDHIEIDDKFSNRIDEEKNHSAWAVAMGLAVRKLDIFDYYKDVEGADNVNLLPNNQEQKKTKRINLMSKISLAPILIVCLLIGGLSYASVMKEDNVLTSQLVTLNRVDTLYNQKSSELNNLYKNVKTLVSLQVIQAELTSNQGQILSSYKHINNTIPEGVWLTELSFTSPNKVKVVGNTMSDRDVLTFVNNLKENGFFSKASLKTLHADKKFNGSSTVVKAFTLLCELADVEQQVASKGDK